MIDQINEIQQMLRSLKTVVGRIEKNAGKNTMEMTERMAQNHHAKMAWDCIERDKLVSDIHAVAVDLGISPMRKPEYYDGDLEFQPTAFHHYRYKIRKPKALQDRPGTR